MTGDDPFVSVVIPVLNTERYLSEAIDSVLEQEHEALEVIVVDDGSTDGSFEVARGYAPRVRLIRQPNSGIGSARNRGVDAARGNLLAFLDADDRYVRGKIRRQVETLGSDPGLEAVYGHAREFISPDVAPEDMARLRRPREQMPAWLSWSMLIRRSAFERVGGFATDLAEGVDIDWFARTRSAGLRVLMLPEVVVERRLHRENNWRRAGSTGTGHLLAVRAMLDRRRSARQ